MWYGPSMAYRHFFMKFKMVQYACACCYNKHDCEEIMSIRAVYQPPEMWYIPPPALRKVLGG